jgi:hypothetical protein
MIWPDTAANDKLNYEIAHQLDPMTGDIATIIEGSRNLVNEEYRPKPGDIATINEGSRNLVNQEFRYLYDDYAATHPGAEIHGEGGH